MRIVLLGDSHLARITDDLDRIGDDVVNAAVGGSVAADVLAQADAVGVGPRDVAVVSVGTNDAAPWKQVDPDDFRAQLERLVEQVQPYRWVHVAPPGVDELRMEREVDRTNELVARYQRIGGVVLGDAGAELVDTPRVLSRLGSEAFVDDGVHLSAAGYALLVPAIADAVEDAVG
ncbi:hypothetical protein ENKNEFLB_02361 [Nocardioides aquaticus]|uniref:SGNH hydrolase-type esterase domain-containing protein n=1 Tax=Nocardioides aquaticus TaxID=160826 RepID=A0ABX8EHI8_9ACTN|nr:SGNH/GDSL hydrolase family protein [Nocardioides aquaticus]QVT79971.1 hypothetical protein ENKNEFLB_02361 [Nocardioides aquaticus]